MEVLFFATVDEFSAWLSQHYATAKEQWVGFYKKGSGRQSIVWAEAVDVALCYGWIDGHTKGIDAASYKIRFTPRKKNSIWSAVNIKRVAELTAEGRMHPAGLAAFAERSEAKSGVYFHEQKEQAVFDQAFASRFMANSAAWEFWQAQPPGYRNQSTFWVMSAKKAETRERRLETLIEASAQGKRVTS